MSGQQSQPTPLRVVPNLGRGQFPVVGIGASAGGLEACSKLVAALPARSGMAFILVQHLDPGHDSMLADLLARDSAMPVRQAAEGMLIEPDQIYVIPPACYLGVGNGALHLSAAPRGARLPFDFLLHALAQDYGDRALCVILSGNGADGSAGLAVIKARGGRVIVQDPDEAGYDGMPRSAIATGLADFILRIERIPDALAALAHRRVQGANDDGAAVAAQQLPWIGTVIELLRNRTAHDFTLYKPGTLNRRIERRMAMAGIEASNLARYLDMLRHDQDELDLLAKDLLINVTCFFRDPEVFDLLAETVLPDLVRNQPPDRPLRIWITGCSTGEETYSLAMLFREAIIASNRNIKLQIFASDVDPDVVDRARAGIYPQTIEAEVSAKRLARFFTKESHGGYRILPELRALVVFTVQDVVADPPFSNLDFVSCRNLLIYLRPEAQAKVIALFHFALREDGFLLLGSAETAGNFEGRFQAISKPARLYRHVGRRRPGEFAQFMNSGDGVRVPARTGAGHPATRQAMLAELTRRLVAETYAPAAVLINAKLECLYSLGPTDRYLRVVPGHPSHDLLAMARQSLRVKLRTAIDQTRAKAGRVTLPGGRMSHDGKSVSFNIDVQSVTYDGEDLLLIAFIDDTDQAPGNLGAAAAKDGARLAELEQELEATRAELQSAIRDLELSSEEQMTINEEALSVNEEYQSTNEELLTSKEELQSLNEELTALNSQLQETLERQRTTANDLQNVLYSTDIATLFLDTHLNIRFFTPAVRHLFNVIPGDVGRPLADLRSLAADSGMPNEARAVLDTLVPTEREIETPDGLWFNRRILPYRTDDHGVEGVVITFSDITERKHAAKALEAAKQHAEQANLAKSRFLAAASHDLRQPLQTLTLLQGMLARLVTNDKAEKLVGRLETTVAAMSGMLNALLDINQIEAGIVRARPVAFQINDLLHRLVEEFSYQAEAQGLVLRAVPCGRTIISDPNLLEQMIRNLLSNALKYTKQGKVLIGCRRRSDMLSIEIWDTGIGIPEPQLQAIFEEYHQLDNAARERSHGLGLGLAVVQRLGNLLNHHIRVRSHLGAGSVFAIEVGLAAAQAAPLTGSGPAGLVGGGDVKPRRTGLILVVEDDPDVREPLEFLLGGEGHRTVAAADGPAALQLVAEGGVQPDLILADYNLPNGIDGLQLALELREAARRCIPAIVLTGDISTDTLDDVARHDCVYLNKPVKADELARLVQHLLRAVEPAPTHPTPAAPQAAAPIIFLVDDDAGVRDGMRSVLEADGRVVEDFSSCEAFLAAYRPGGEACLLLDAALPGMSGLDLLGRLRQAGTALPAIMITGNGDVPMAVRAMKAGASDFIEKPVRGDDLLAVVARALDQARDVGKLTAWRQNAADHVAELTPHQRQIMELVLAGHPSKNIAADLGISQRTVENHRASIMKRTGSKSLPALARMALAAAWTGEHPEAEAE